MAKHFGKTEPRIWTKPLRELTPETSLGFEVIRFAADVLGIVLYPWQQWLLIHALELLPNGDYRFRRVVVLVARQNGKTLLGSVLTAWWLFSDSRRHPERIPPVRFKVVGVAQNLDIAREPWAGVKMWCDPQPDTEEEAELAIPALQKRAAKVVDTNGKESIVARNRAHYEIRAAANARGKPAARVLMDETREQKDWRAWNAVSQTLKSFGGLGQLWAISNAGDPNAVVLKAQREVGLKAIESFKAYVEAGILSAEEFANGNDVSVGLFEWSAPDCEMDDVEAILQANPSIGHGALTVDICLADMPPSMAESGYRTEVLCQWVTAKVDPHITPDAWRALADPESRIADGSELVLAVDTAFDRKWSYLAVAGWRDDGLKHVELIAQRPGMLWVGKAAEELRERWPTMTHAAVQVRGCPASEFVDVLTEADFEVIEVGGSTLGAVPGGFHDMVRDRKIRHLGQPAAAMSFEGAMTKQLNEVRVWDRVGSGTDAAPAVALSEAAWALDHLPEPVDVPDAPDAPAVLRPDDFVASSAGDQNILTAAF
ncbi:hypothetical protein ACXR2W_00835 [Leucobacter sp. HY1908]